MTREMRITESLTDTEINELHAGIAAADPGGIAPRRFEPLRLGIHDDDRRLIAGLNGGTAWSWLQIYGLWVAGEYRGQDLGYRLLRTAEEIAVARGCYHASLSTFGFQARGFYVRCGYTVYGQLEGYPAGHTHFHLRKALVPAPPTDVAG